MVQQQHIYNIKMKDSFSFHFYLALQLLGHLDHGVGGGLGAIHIIVLGVTGEDLDGDIGEDLGKRKKSKCHIAVAFFIMFLYFIKIWIKKGLINEAKIALNVIVIELIACSTSPYSAAFAVPIPCEARPYPTPIAIG